MSFSKEFKILLDEITNITPEKTIKIFEEYITKKIEKDKNEPANDYNCNFIICDWEFPRVLINSNNKKNCLLAIKNNLLECGFIEMSCNPRSMTQIKQFVFSKEILTNTYKYISKPCSCEDADCSMLSITI